MSNSSSSSSGVETAVSVLIVFVGASSFPASLLMVAMISLSLSFGGKIHEGAADGSMVMVLVLSSAKRLFLLGGDDGEEDRNMVYV